MCGIVGYVGHRQAAPILLDGLEKLEYRGYDSAGISVLSGGVLDICKEKGRLSVLRESLKNNMPTGTVGIGHTRWATHGAPADFNAHPHFNMDRTISLVHNGIIENYQSLRDWLISMGYEFRSETDTEVVVQLVDYYFKGDLRRAVEQALSKIRGSYAICVMSSHCPGMLVAARKDSPLVVGKGDGENFFASDVPALLKCTRDVYYLEDGDVAEITADRISIFNSYGAPAGRTLSHIDWDAEAAEKGGYPHFMLKEIYEEPEAIERTFRSKLSESGELNFSDIGITEELAKGINRAVIVGCGTAYHAGVAGKYILERLLGVPVEVDVASEYRYRDPIVRPGDLFVAISQSGETADTLAAMRLAKAKGARIISLTNVVGSTHSREADAVIYTVAGPEIAVASTKAYTTQILCLLLLGLALGRLRGSADQQLCRSTLEEISRLPDMIRQVLTSDKDIRRIAYRYSAASDIYFFGRNIDWATALEGSLKLKEISYIHSEGFAAGELKHGPIALIEQDTPVVAIATEQRLFEKLASNIKEVKARGANILAVCPAGADLVLDSADESIIIPECSELVSPILSVVPLQLFAYDCCISRGYDPDKPRNLAKSVTVE